MPMVIKVTGIKVAQEHFERFSVAMADNPTLMREIGTTIAAYASGEGFTSRGQVYGQPWDPLSDKYAARKATKWGTPMEVQTGAMQDGFGVDYTPGTVVVRNKVEVSGKSGTYNLLTLQQKGTKRGLPPRMILALNDTLKATILGMVKLVIQTKLKETKP